MAGVLSEGRRLDDRFVLRQRLGGGHHGSSVWLAEDLQASRPVALKCLGHPADAAQRRALLEHERAAMSRVQHSAVARALDVIEAEGQSFLMMDAVLGQSAGSVSLAGIRPRELSSLRGAPGEDWIRPALQLASGLTAVHDAGVIHRDVKASNVLIDAQGNALLIDFGVAAIVSDAPAKHALRSGGSPLSMSPQQRAGDAPSIADDVYAFGVLLHELAFGRVPVEGVSAGADASSAGLADLIRRCLQEAPADRPADMRQVAKALAQVASTDFNATRAPLALRAVKAAEFIQAAPVRSVARVGAAATAAGKASRGASGGVPWRLLGAVSAVWLLVLSGVVLSLLSPKVDAPATVGRTSAPPAPTAEEPSRAESSIAAPMEFARLRRERDAMLDDVNRVLDLRSALEARDVANWGGDAYLEAVALGDRGDELFKANDFIASAEAYAQAATLFEELEVQAPEVAASRLQDGWAAYEAGKAADAILAFEQALAIDDSLRDARDGLGRAQQLDQVLALTSKAQDLERAGDLRDAASAYEQVLALDGDRQDARTALANLRSRLDRSSFDQRMSEGFAALSAGDFTGARRAFEAAGRLDPNASVVRDALAQVDVDARGQQLSALGTKAEQLVAQERWREALEAYDQALAIDASLRFAREGREVAARMSELYEQLSFYADDPQRLTDNSILQRAARVLDSARQATPRGPQLEERQDRLARAIDEVRQPVLVRLASDNRTEVRILRAADLGRFQQTELQLRPGRYTVIGTRDGYRDVREEFTVTVGGQSQVIDVRCVEKI